MAKRKMDNKNRPGFRFTLGRNLTAMASNYLFAGGQPHAGAFINVTTMQTDERLKNSFHILFAETDAAIFYGYLADITNYSTADRYRRRLVLLMIL